MSGAERRDQEAHHRVLLRASQTRIDSYMNGAGRLRRLQIGAGNNLLEGWLNTDVEPLSDEGVFLDARQPFPFDDRVFDYVFSEHIIEHVPYKDGLFMLREARRVLKPGGKIRIGTPDAARIVGLLADTKSQSQAEYVRWFAVHVLGLYSEQLSPLQQRRPEWAIDAGHIARHFPEAGTDCACFVVNYLFRGFGHQFLYDERTLAAAMLEAGFEAVQRSTVGHSDDAELHGIECHGQIIGDAANAFETMVLQAFRPGVPPASA